MFVTKKKKKIKLFHVKQGKRVFVIRYLVLMWDVIREKQNEKQFALVREISEPVVIRDCYIFVVVIVRREYVLFSLSSFLWLNHVRKFMICEISLFFKC